MNTSDIFENPLDPKAAAGASALGKAVGDTASGGNVAKAADQLGQGKSISGALAKALDPYADVLMDIFSNPKYRTVFQRIVNSIKADKAKAQKAAAAAPAESVTEDQDSVDAVAGAVTRRIMSQHLDILSKYGPGKVLAAIDDVAQFAGGDGLDEIGSSDVSIWTKQVIQDLESGHFDHVDEAVGDYTVKTVSPADAWKKHTEPKKSKSKVPVDPKTGKTLYQKVTSEEVEEDAVDTVTLDVPLMIRMLEYAREDAKDDMDLHDVAERMIAMAKDGPLSMDDYDSIVGDAESHVPNEVDEVSNKTLSSYTDKAAKERDAYHADRNKDAESARKYHNRKAGVRKALSITKEDEQLDELSPQTLGSYVAKSAEDEKRRRAKGIEIRDRLRAATGKNFGTPIDPKLYSPTASRKAGQKRAIDKLTGTAKVAAKESYYTPGPETMPGAVGPQEDTNLSFNQTKRIGDSSVTVSANAKSMEELHTILKLAGLDHVVHSEEPSVADAATALAPEAPAEEPCGCDDAPEVSMPMVSTPKPLDLKYTTDKTALINAIKDKLAKRLS